MFMSLDFLYVPTADVDLAVDSAVEVLGAELVWKIRAMGTTVACLRVTEAGPALLLSGHLEGEAPILVYRVADYKATVAQLRKVGATDLRELDIPHGPCASFRLGGNQRFAVYELVRPGMDAHFAGRIDP
jgi:hypothetical protein